MGRGGTTATATGLPTACGRNSNSLRCTLHANPKRLQLVVSSMGSFDIRSCICFWPATACCHRISVVKTTHFSLLSQLASAPDLAVGDLYISVADTGLFQCCRRRCCLSRHHWQHRLQNQCRASVPRSSKTPSTAIDGGCRANCLQSQCCA